MKRYIKINIADNVAVALDDIASDETLHLDGQEVVGAENIARGHKIALTHIVEGESVLKYGYPIGQATKRLEQGSGFTLTTSRHRSVTMWSLAIRPI